MSKPIRIQRKRTAGFSLQSLSQSTNGLSAVSVCRPGPFGNPFRVEKRQAIDSKPHGREVNAYLKASQDDAHQQAVDRFKTGLDQIDLSDFLPVEATKIRDHFHRMRANLYLLTGKNIACFCRLDQPCHGDILLLYAETR